MNSSYESLKPGREWHALGLDRRSGDLASTMTMPNITIRLALSGLALAAAMPAASLDLNGAPALVDDVTKKDNDKKAKAVTVWILEAKGPS